MIKIQKDTPGTRVATVESESRGLMVHLRLCPVNLRPIQLSKNLKVSAPADLGCNGSRNQRHLNCSPTLLSLCSGRLCEDVRTMSDSHSLHCRACSWHIFTLYHTLHVFMRVTAKDGLAGSPPDYVDVEAYQQTKHTQDDTARALGTCGAARL